MNTKHNLYHCKSKAAKQCFPFVALYTLLLATIVCACDDFVQLDTPENQLSTQTVFEESATANAAMTDIYSKMREAGVLAGTATGISNLMGNYADELTFYGGVQSQTEVFYNNTVVPLNSTVKNIWNSSYSQIYAANAVIEGVSKASQLPDTDRKQLKGEALFVRAILHFYLTNLFGAVPYITTTDYELNRKVHRNTAAEIYNDAATDLENAIELLDSDYRTQGRVRPNKFAAYALLARVKLYQAAWDDAANAASAVLNQTATYAFETNLNKVFLKGSTTTLWQFMPKNVGGNTYEASTFIFLNGPPPESALSENLLAAFEPGDQRKNLWIQTITKATNAWSHAFKYKQRSNTASSMENSIVLRTAELYLIRAEARARLGELIGAKEDLNTIRNRAGLANTTAMTQQEILTALLQERRVELFTEFGHRFFDLKRFEKANEVLAATKDSWQSANLLLPIPQAELDVNPALLPQNQGY